MTPEERKRRKDERRKARLFAREARTFTGLVEAYKAFFGLTMNEGAWELLCAAREVAKEFPGMNVWDSLVGAYPVVEEVLLYAAQRYDLGQGPFVSLFRRNLAERLRRDASRLAKRKRKRKEATLELATGLARPEPDEVAAARDRWTSRLFELALARLDPLTRDFIRLHLAGVSVEDIARRLGVSKKTLSNKFGRGPRGDDYTKLARPVQEEVRRLVDELPERHLHLLVRHLLDEAGLPRGEVERLLGRPVPDPASTFLMTEDEVLQELGWGGVFSCGEVGKSRPPKGVLMVERPSRRLCG